MFTNNKIEIIKTFIIVVLFITTVLLLYFLWRDSDFEELGFSEAISFYAETPSPKTLSVKDVILPTKADILFSNGDFTEYTNSVSTHWDSFARECLVFLESEDIHVEEITLNQWNEAMKFKYIRFTFEESIPFHEFFEFYGGSRLQNLVDIGSFSIIAYSTASKESVLVGDPENDSYYRLVSDSYYKEEYGQTGFEEYIDTMQEGWYEKYYPISTFFGVENETLLSVSNSSKLLPYSFKREDIYSNEEALNSFVESFFGESYDFVRKISEDNGNTIYMYGYGQKVLNIEPDGTFEYREEVNSSNNESFTYLQSLQRALLFISNHGGFETLEGESFYPFLSSFTEIKNGEKEGFRFCFELKTFEYPALSETIEPIIVDVLGEQVTYFKREVIMPVDAVLSQEDLTVYSVTDLLTERYQEIYDTIYKGTVRALSVNKGAADEVFNFIMGKINYESTGYFQKEDFFYPAWIMGIEDVYLFFDLYTGEYLGIKENL